MKLKINNIDVECNVDEFVEITNKMGKQTEQPKQIETKLPKQQIKKVVEKQTQNFWSKDEIFLLKETYSKRQNFGKKGICLRKKVLDRLSKQFGRSKKNISNKAVSLGFTKRGITRLRKNTTKKPAKKHLSAWSKQDDDKLVAFSKDTHYFNNGTFKKGTSKLLVDYFDRTPSSIANRTLRLKKEGRIR